ncbi:hypothetical protein U7230_11430 [Carboxydochorda subterranea]|uniref:Uncharacterized protein n=1 Tax=Carboxydichorda subterranea TaxID=3109565 RepID=A0ABZ1BV99_9FIRM|nr:hypothetical protein [Limnochorda sp. L945t]WRP16697.1 hypothetical protein U7230_11430 [Limnochorda sp. L945t]
MAVGVKEDVIRMIRELPDNVTLDDIMRELYFRLAVERGLKNLDEGKALSHEEAKEHLKRWLS